jgi:hypothetical protein
MANIIQFKKELARLLKKHGASINWECGEGSDTHGIYDEKITVLLGDGQRYDLNKSSFVDENSLLSRKIVRPVKVNKYDYMKVIQQNYGQGFEDVSEYECNSQGVCSQMSGKFINLPSGKQRELLLITHDLAEYRLLGYPIRTIKRRKLRQWSNNSTKKHDHYLFKKK